jgi:hypothetical protein
MIALCMHPQDVSELALTLVLRWKPRSSSFAIILYGPESTIMEEDSEEERQVIIGNIINSLQNVIFLVYILSSYEASIAMFRGLIDRLHDGGRKRNCEVSRAMEAQNSIQVN